MIANIMAMQAAANGLNAASAPAFQPLSGNAAFSKINRSAIGAQGMGGVLESLLSAYTYGSEGDNRMQAFFTMFPDADAAFQREARRLGIAGFANGGMPLRSGVSIVGERGAEVISPMNPAMVIPIQNNAEMLREMQNQSGLLNAMVNVLQFGFQALIENNESAAEAMDKMAGAQRRLARKAS
jgi:hypothetical protein